MTIHVDQADRRDLSTVGELYSGVRDGSERQALDSLSIAFRAVPLTREIAIQGGLHRRTFSHGVQLADALIAASAESSNADLFTLNTKHYPMLARAITPYQKA